MPTITTSIGTDARDYSTITGWEADLDNVGVYSSGDDAVGECYDDSAFNESVTINGGGTVSLNSIMLSVASGERHDGIAGTGARIVGGSQRTVTAHPGIDCDIEWLEFENASVVLNANNNGGRKSARRILLHDVGVGVASPAIGGNSNASGVANMIVQNSIVYGITANLASSVDAIANFNSFNNSPTAYGVNITVHNAANSGSGNLIGINCVSEPNKVIRNCLVTDCDVCFSGSPGTESNNASSDATASGTGSLTNIVTADQYVSTVGGSEDLHLKPGSDCIGAGADLGTTPSGVELDIDGYDRDDNGVVWDIGADQFTTVEENSSSSSSHSSSSQSSSSSFSSSSDSSSSLSSSSSQSSSSSRSSSSASSSSSSLSSSSSSFSSSSESSSSSFSSSSSQSSSSTSSSFSSSSESSSSSRSSSSQSSSSTSSSFSSSSSSSESSSSLTSSSSLSGSSSLSSSSFSSSSSSSFSSSSSSSSSSFSSSSSSSSSSFSSSSSESSQNLVKFPDSKTVSHVGALSSSSSSIGASSISVTKPVS